MRAIVLGSAAGGGLPQWNCACENCRLAWAGDPRIRPRTQTSLAITGNGADWLLLNASPDLRQQILATPALQPKGGARQSPIRAVMLTGGEVDCLAGLLTLRERQSFLLYGMRATLGTLDCPIFGVLDAKLVERRAMELGIKIEITDLVVTPFAVPGKSPLYRESDSSTVEEGETIGLVVERGGRHLIYVPGCAEITGDVMDRIDGADVLLFDGTTLTDNELRAQGVSDKSARRMGHLPMSGPDGSLARLADVAVRRRIFIHLNNTNPVLREDSAERRTVEDAGWEIAFDGMDIDL